MVRWHWGALLALVMLLAGCAASGPKYAEVEASMPSLRPGQGRIVFLRTTGFGPGVRPDIRLNGDVVGASEPGSFFFVDRPVGRYTASARTEVESSVEVQVRDGEVSYVESRITMGLFIGHPLLSIATEPQALAALPSLAYTGAIPLVPGRPRQSATRPSPASPAGVRPGGVTMDDLRGLLPPAKP
jgi:hypothetical protein